MKLFDKYFQPYAEYCIRTTLSEDELKEALAKKCPATSDGETILHISIAQSRKYKWLLYAIGFFALFWGVAASFVIWWGIFLSVVFIGLLFIVLECCHAMAMDEVPQIRQDFEILLRFLERKGR